MVSEEKYFKHETNENSEKRKRLSFDILNVSDSQNKAWQMETEMGTWNKKIVLKTTARGSYKNKHQEI